MISWAFFYVCASSNKPVVYLNSSIFQAIVCDVPLLSNEDTVQCVSYDRKGRYIITGTNKGKLIIYDAKTLKMVNWVKQNSTQSVGSLIDNDQT